MPINVNNDDFQFINAGLGGAQPVAVKKAKGIKKSPPKQYPPPKYEDISYSSRKFIEYNRIPHTLKNHKWEKEEVILGGTAYKPEDVVYVSDCWMSKKNTAIIKDCITGNYTRRDYCKKIMVDLKNLKSDYSEHYDTLPILMHRSLGPIYALSKEEAIANGYEECISDGCFYNDGYNKQRDLEAQPGNYNKYKNIVQQTIKYCDKQTQIKYGVESNSYLLTDGLKYTFGCELEFSKLYIPTYLKYKYNMECMRDGSLNKHIPGNVGGPELVTGIFKGDAGFNHLQDICIEASSRCVIDKQCGVHVHVGGFTRNNDFILLAYILGTKIQQEFLQMVPKSRRNNEYCKLLKDMKWIFVKEESAFDLRMRKSVYFDELFKYLSVGQSLGKRFNTLKQHPMGAKTNYDHATPRYCWLNLIPTAFNTRENQEFTIEFRHMQGSSNFTKIYNWIKICMAFVYFVEHCQERIMYDKVITIDDIIKAAYPRSARELISYVKDCKSRFTKKEAEEQEYIEKTTTKKKIKEIICV